MASVSLETLVLDTVFCLLTKKKIWEIFWNFFLAFFRVKNQLKLLLFSFFGNFLQIFYITNLKENPN
jgi:hypothetical protein